jgi:hypothetical protein
MPLSEFSASLIANLSHFLKITAYICSLILTLSDIIWLNLDIKNKPLFEINGLN